MLLRCIRGKLSPIAARSIPDRPPATGEPLSTHVEEAQPIRAETRTPRRRSDQEPRLGYNKSSAATQMAALFSHLDTALLAQEVEVLAPVTHHTDSSRLKQLLAPSVGDPTDRHLESLITEIYTQPGTLLAVWQESGQQLGAVGIRHTGPGAAEILHIAIDPAYRRQGIGRSMIEQTIQREGLRELQAETDSNAVGFYRRCGFRVASLGERYPGVERFVCIWRSDALER